MKKIIFFTVVLCVLLSSCHKVIDISSVFDFVSQEYIENYFPYEGIDSVLFINQDNDEIWLYPEKTMYEFKENNVITTSPLHSCEECYNVGIVYMIEYTFFDNNDNIVFQTGLSLMHNKDVDGMATFRLGRNAVQLSFTKENVVEKFSPTIQYIEDDTITAELKNNIGIIKLIDVNGNHLTIK